MSSRSIVFIDSRVTDYEAIIAGLNLGTRWHVLDAQQDGIAQIERLLAGETDLDAIHIISHGAPGTLYLGSTVLISSNLPDHAQRLQSIGTSLTAAGDLLLYGCNVAQGEEGEAFVNALAALTGADVAASVVNTPPTFVVPDGTLLVPVGFGPDYGHSIIQQADGKLVVAGSSNYGSDSDFSLVRLNSNGDIDSSFGTEGKLILPVGLSFDHGYTVIQQADGKLVVAGSSFTGSVNDPDYSLVRLNADGSLDSKFGTSGKLSLSMWASYRTGANVIQQTDGKLVAVGTIFSGSHSSFSIVRLNIDGRPDSTFGADGELNLPVGSSFDYGNSVIQQADGKLVVAGTSDNGTNYYDFSLVRLNIDGTLDNTFGISGKQLIPAGLGFNSGSYVIQQSDGKLVMLGTSYYGGSADFMVVRLNTDGSLDDTFGIGGKQLIPVGLGTDWSSSIIQQADGKLVVAGTSENGSDSDFSLVRLNSDGSLDETFAVKSIGVKKIITSGKLLLPVGLGDDDARSVIQQTDGKLVLAGSSWSGTDSDFSVIRLNEDGSLDSTFAPKGTLQQMGPAAFIEGWSQSSVLAPAAQVLDVGLLSAGSYAGATLTLARQGGTQAQDVFSSSGTMTALNQGSYFAVDGTTIGRVTANGNGTLVLTFNSNATQSLVNKAMQQIAYANTSDAPPSTVAIDWTFNDGNTGAQGIGGALSVTSTSYVVITPTNDAPYLAAPILAQRFAADRLFSFQLPFVDPDLELLTYTVTMADGTGVPPWLTFNRDTQTFSGTPTSNDLGTFNFKIRVTDAAGVSAYGSMNVTVYENIAPVLANALEDRSVTLGSSLNFAFAGNTFTDADSPSLTYTAKLANGAALPSWLSFDPATRTFSGTPGAADVGQLAITVIATDLDQASATDTFILTITEVNIIHGSDASETLTGSEGTDRVDAGPGDDRIEGLAGNDILNGGNGIDTAVYTGNAAQYTIRIDRVNGSATVTDSQSQRDGTDTLTGIERLQFGVQTFELLNPARTTVPKFGQANSFLFDPSYYLLSNPDLANSVTMETAFNHYSSTGAEQGRNPNTWFDPVYYANRWDDLKVLDLTADILFQHYNLYGVWEGRSAGPAYDRYDGNRYLEDNPDVAAYVDAYVADFLGSRTNGAVAHFLIYGANEGRVAYDLDGSVIPTDFTIEAALVGVPG